MLGIKDLEDLRGLTDRDELGTGVSGGDCYLGFTQRRLVIGVAGGGLKANEVNRLNTP